MSTTPEQGAFVPPPQYFQVPDIILQHSDIIRWLGPSNPEPDPVQMRTYMRQAATLFQSLQLSQQAMLQQMNVVCISASVLVLHVNSFLVAAPSRQQSECAY